jgi:hypothetical protein
VKQNAMLVAALWGGATMGVLSALPFINVANCCCLWVTAGGLIAAYVLQANASPGVAITSGDGALAGLLAGLIGAIVFAVVSLPINLLLGPMQQRFLQQFVDSSRDVPDEMRGLLSSMEGATGTVVKAVVGFFVMLVAGAVFSTLGGLLGAVLFRRKAAPIVPGPGETS